MEGAIMSNSNKKKRIVSDNYRSARLQVCFRTLGSLTSAYKGAKRFKKLDALQAAQEHIAHLEQALAHELAKQGSQDSVDSYRELFRNLWNSLFESHANTPRRGRRIKAVQTPQGAVQTSDEYKASVDSSFSQGDLYYLLSEQPQQQEPIAELTKMKFVKCRKRLEELYEPGQSDVTYEELDNLTYDPCLSQTSDETVGLVLQPLVQEDMFVWSPVKNVTNLY